jgi:hypothetical protein
VSHGVAEAKVTWPTLPAGPQQAMGLTVRVGGCAVAVHTDGRATVDWLLSYLADFWQADPGTVAGAHAEIVALVDPRARQGLCALVDGSAAARKAGMFMGATGRSLTLPGPRVLAGCPEQRVAFARGRSQIAVLGDDRDALGPATVRLVRAAAGAWLEARGWAHVHAAGAATGDTGLLAFGPKGAGKTTAVTALAARGGWRLLAHDRAYVGIVGGQPRAVPWPSSLNIGVGLLSTLGWADILRARYRSGERPPYHQKDVVTSALLAGRTTAVRERSRVGTADGGTSGHSGAAYEGRAPWTRDAASEDCACGCRGAAAPGEAARDSCGGACEGRRAAREQGRELKAQILPAQVTEWFGVKLAPGAALAAVIFPQIDLSRSQPLVRPLDRAAFSGGDVFPPRRDADYFPDFLCLTGRTDPDRAGSALTILRAVGDRVPAYRILLGRDLTANARVLAELVQ